MTFQDGYSLARHAPASPEAMPPAFLAVGSADAGEARAALDAADYRLHEARLTLLDEEFDSCPDHSLLWLELCADDRQETVAEAIRLAGARMRALRRPMIVSVALEQLDHAMELVEREAADAELLVEPDAIERSAAIALAMTRAAHGGSASVRDGVIDDSEADLQRLSAEVNRIAQALARLSKGPGAAGMSSPSHLLEGRGPGIDSPGTAISSETVRAAIRARRLRERFFDAHLFADPAWDMLLDLFAAEISQQRVAVSSLCIAACVPPTTALRWIKTMTDHGLFERRSDPHDGRRIFIQLSGQASQAMQGYFAQMNGLIAA